MIKPGKTSYYVIAVATAFLAVLLVTGTISPKKAAAQQAPPAELVFFLRGDSPNNPFTDLSNYHHPVNLVADTDGHNVNQVYDGDLSRSVLSFFTGGYIQIPDSYGLLKVSPGCKLTFEIRVKTLTQTPLYYCQTMPANVQPPDQFIFDKGPLDRTLRNYALGFGWYANNWTSLCGSGVKAYIPSISFCAGQQTNTGFLFNQNDLSVLVGWKIFAFEMEVIPNTGQYPDLSISQYPYLLTIHSFINGIDKGTSALGHNSTSFDGTLPPLHIGNGYSTWGRTQFQPNPFYGVIDYVRIFKGHLLPDQLNTNLLGPIPDAVNLPLNTPTGTNVTVQPMDANSGAQPVSVTFSNVSQAGMTLLTVASSGPALPSSLKTGTAARYYDISSSAFFSTPVQVCVNYSGVSFSNESVVKLYQYKNSQWVDVTTSLDTNSDVICGTVSSLSAFAVLEPKPNTPPQAQCRNLSLDVGANGLSRTIAALELNNGSSDPDGDTLQYSVDNTGPFSLGTTTVTLTVSDGRGGSSSCAATVTVAPASPPELLLFLKGSATNPFLDLSPYQHPVTPIEANGNNVAPVFEPTLVRDVLSFANGGYLEVADNRGLLKLGSGDKLTIEINAKFFDQNPPAYFCSLGANPLDQMLFEKGLINGFPRNYAMAFGWYQQANYAPCGGAVGYVPSSSFASGSGTSTGLSPGAELSGWKLFAYYLEVVPNTGQSPMNPPASSPYLLRAVYFYNGTYRIQIFHRFDNNVFSGSLPPLNIGNGYSTLGTKQMLANPFYGAVDYIRVYKGFLPQSQLNKNPSGPIPVIINTPSGPNVAVNPVDASTGSQPVNVTFASVTQGGTTALTTSSAGPAPPSGFVLGSPATYYDVTTTSSYTSLIQVCIKYAGVSYQDEAALKLLHYENGQWTDVTTYVDTANDLICGRVSSLSPFAVMEHIPNRPPRAVGKNITLEVGPNCMSRTITGSDMDAGSSDPDNDRLTFSVNDPGPFSLGVHSVILTVTDGRGGLDAYTGSVTVVDRTAASPDIPSLPDISGECSAEITVRPTASDNCAGRITGSTTGPLKFSVQGTHTVTWTYDDGHGNLSTQAQAVIVKDITAPSISASDPICVTIGNGNNKSNKISLAATDNCSLNPTLQITKVEVFNNGGNPVNGNGIWSISGNDVYVNPNGNGWTVKVTAVAVDNLGNTRTVQITKSLLKC